MKPATGPGPVLQTSSKPRVLIAHNKYQQRGGEDAVVEAEHDLLLQHGHEVELYERHNDEVKSSSRLKLLGDTFWSRQTSREIDEVVDRFRPQLIHVHNTLPLISPSIYWAARRHGIPVVQTLHNFRFICPQAQFLRDGKVCEACVGHLPWRAVQYSCYRGSKSQSAVLASAIGLHRTLGTYSKAVTRYVALNDFCRDKFVQGGIAAEQIRIKPNFVADAFAASPEETPRAGGLFVGRISHDKGIAVLLQAVKSHAFPDLKVVGTGDMDAEVAAALGPSYLGPRKLPEILSMMRAASYLVVPSIWYENFPRTIVEAYSSGVPVIASRLGALAEIVIDGETGLLFEPGSSQDLGEKMRWASEHPLEMLKMGRNARRRYLDMYSPETNYRLLSDIYTEALAEGNAQR